MPADKRALLKQRLQNGEINLQPLTFPQRELWEASPVPVTDMANHICCLIEVRGAITPRECEAALDLVVQRQEALRLSFLPGKERPLQMIRKDCPASLRILELSSAERSPEAVEHLAREIFSEPFDLVQGPLYRTVLLQRSATEHSLVFAIHHAIADGWTLGVFVKELALAYFQALQGDRTPLPSVTTSYSAWGAAERAFWQPAELERRAAFWKHHLAGSGPLWPGTAPAPPGAVHQRMVCYIPADLADATRELARRSEATLFSTLLAAFHLAMTQWTGKEDIVFGVPVAHRSKEAVRETMGYFAGVVPLRPQIDRDRPFAENLRHVHQTTVDAFANAMPFAELVRAVGVSQSPGRNSVFDVRFALQNHPIPDVDLPKLSARLRMRSTGTPRFALGCEVTEHGEKLEVVWLFRANMFSPDDIQNLNRIFQTVLAGARPCKDSSIAPSLICTRVKAPPATENLGEPREPHWMSRSAFQMIVIAFAVTEAALGATLHRGWLWPAVPLVLVASHFMHGLLIGFHEATHGLLRSNRRFNEFDGVLIGVFSLTSFSLYRAAHQTHHMHLGTERDEELWPFVHPEKPRWLRILAAFLELFAGLFFTPCLFVRTFLRSGSPIRSRKVRRRIWGEFALMAAAWAGILAAVAHWHAWTLFVWMYLMPAGIAANLQSWRKYIEHVGLCGSTINSATRNIVSGTRLGRVFACTLLHEPYHGVHHLHAGVPHARLPQFADELEPVTAEERPPFPSYRHALLDLLHSLADPRVGAQWQSATAVKNSR